jgi:uncharacterized repeat protein (TIGR01451 family)
MKISIRAFARVVALLMVVAVSPSVFGATVSWDAGGGDENWSNALNWSGDALPTSGDDVIITTAGTGTVILSQNATVNSINVATGAYLHVGNGWVLTVDGPGMSTVDPGGTLQLDGGSPSGGSLSGNGDLTVSGVFHVFGNGTLSGSGALAINNGGELHFGTLVAGWVMSLSRNTTNTAGGKITFGINSLADTNVNATITNSGIIEIQNDRALGGTATLNNNSGGVVQRTTSAGTAAINFAVNNASGATIEVQSGTLALSGDTVNSGTITGAGEVDASGNFGWSGGTITGSGPRVLTSTSTPTFSCDVSECLLDGAALQLQASSTFDSFSNDLRFSNNATLTIAAGKTLSIAGTSDISNGGGANSIINNGTIRKHTPLFVSRTISVPVTLSGTSTVDIGTGTLKFAGGADIAGGATLDIAGGTSLEVTGGVFLVNSGPVSMPGSGVFRVSAGALRVPIGISALIPNVTLQGSGVIDGAGTLVLSGASSWAGGTMGSAAAPGGITQINPGSTLTITAAGGTLSQGRLLQNLGTLSLPTSDGINLSGSATIENYGTIAKGGGTSTIQPRVENKSGATVSVSSGTLALSGGGSTVGNYDMSSGAFLTLAGGTFTVSSTATVTGSGQMIIDGATFDAGAGVDVTCPAVLLYPGGTITGAGTVRVSGFFDWLGGTIAGSGPRVLKSTSFPFFDCSAGNCLLDGASLLLQASATFSASSNALVFSNGASLTINAGTTFQITNDGDMTDGGGAASSLINNGTLWKKTTGGISSLGVPVTLSGSSTVKIDTGTLQFGGDTTVGGNAILDIALGKTLEVTGGVFLFNSGTGSMPGSGTFMVSGGTLRIPIGITKTIYNMTLQGSGVIDGGGTLTLAGVPTWGGGTMGSAAAPGGVTQIDSGITLNTAAGAKSLTQSRQLLNNGTFNYNVAGANILTMSGNSKITNHGMLNLAANAITAINVSGSALIENDGTINRNAVTGVCTLNPTVDNHSGGTVSVSAGTLGLNGGGTERGNFTVSSGANLILSGSGVFSMLGFSTVGGAGTFSILGATINAGDGPGGSSDVWIIAAPTTCSGTINLRDASLVLSSAFSVSGTIEHYGGAISGSGTLTINSFGVLNCRGTDSPSTIAINTTINSGGKLNSPANALRCGLSNNITVTNNGLIDFQSDGGLSSFSGAPQLVNNNTGTLKKSAGTGTTGLDVLVSSNSGSTVQADSGTLAFNQGGNFASVTISGAGTVALPATAAVSGTTTLTGKLRLTGNAAVSGTLNESGTLLLDSGVNVTWPNVSLLGGGIDGLGGLHVSGTFNWSGGTISGAGARVLDSTSTPTISCGLCVLDVAALQLQASATYSGHFLQISDGASLIIDPGKTLSVTNGGNFVGDAVSSIVNNGTIWKKTVAGASSIDVPVTLSGTSTVDLDIGTLQFSRGANVASGATIDIAGGTTLEVTGGVFLFNSGSISMPGSGVFKVSFGTLRVPTSIATTIPNVTLQGGTIDGGGTLIPSGTSTWASGSMGSAGAPGGITQIPSGSTLNINSAGSQSLTQSRELKNFGTVNYSGASTLTMSAASIITNNAAFNLTTDGNINLSGSATIDNNGTLTKNGGGGTSTLFPPVNNAGTVSATTGTISLAGGGTNTGAINVTSPGSLSFSSGTHSVSGGSISGSGTLTFSGATATIGVPINVGALNVTGGTATLNANGSADAFTMSGGTLGGSGTLTLNNGGSWSGGTMSGGGTTTNPSSMTFSIPGAVTLNGRTLQNNGTLNVSGAVIGGTGTIANTGTINDTVDATISAPVNNSGQVTASAHLSLAGNGSHTGTFTASSPASVIDFSGGNQTISGPFAGPGKFRFSGGTAAVNNAWSGKLIEVAGGSVALNTSGTLPALNLSGGTLTGSGGLTVTGASTWSGGTIGGSGPLTFDAGATVTMPGTSAATLSRPLVNQGTINFTATSSAMLIDGVPITNSGTMDIQSASQDILVTPGTPPFVNNGTLKKSAGAGAVQFAAPLSNTGLVQIGAGTLNFSGVYAQSAGTTEVQAGATLQTGTLSLNGGTLVGNGTIAGAVDNHAIVAPGASPGTLTISGDYVQASDGELDIQIGGTTPGTDYDQLLVSGNVTLAGTLSVSHINSFVPATGNTFQILTYGGRPNSTAFATINGLDYGSGNTLVPTYGASDLQLVTNSVQADLVASVSAPVLVTNGTTFAYTVSILNQGGSDATNVTFNALLPPNVTFSSASPAICSGAPNLVCTIGALANQSTTVVILDVTANGAGAAPVIVSTTASEFDPNGANNSTSATPSITAGADLRAAVTGTPSTVAGSHTIYTIVVTNSGPDVANNVVVSAAASAGLTFSANGGACTGSFPCNLGALSSGQSVTITSAWDISTAAVVSVQLTVDATSSTSDPDSSNNGAAATTIIGTCPAIVISGPHELTSGASAQATAAATVALAGGAIYNWSISDGTIDSGNGTDTITFTTGAAGTVTLAVNVTGTSCTLSTSGLITVKPRLACQGTAAPSVPVGETTTADAVVHFGWTKVDGASGYRLWLQQGESPAQSLGRTTDTSLTKVIPPGTHHWYVETLFDGCASHESEHLALTILPAQDCDTHGKPQLTAPATEAATTSATVAFSWGAVAKAIEYELWLATAGGVPTLIRVTPDTSYTTDVPPGGLEWYVRAIFGGCAATESAHQTFTYTPPPGCTNQRPLLIAPAEEERLTSPVSFEWREVPEAKSYELSIDGVLAATTTSPRASGIDVPLGERRWRVRARLAEGCGGLDSTESRFVVIPPSPSCTPLEPPLLTAPGQISSGVTGRIQWTFVGGATAYVVQISTDPQFARASTTSSTVAARELPITFTNESNVPAARYVRVYAIDTQCVVPGTGPFSSVAVISVLPPTGSDGVASLTDPTDVPYTLNIAAELAGKSFTAVPTVPWLTVTPASGIVPSGGLTLHALAHTAGLPPGASTGTVVISTAAASGTRAALDEDTSSTAITLNNDPNVTSQAKDTPPPDALTIPAVANVKGIIVRYQSDLYVTNTSTLPINYRIIFTPTGKSGSTRVQTTDFPVAPGATVAVRDLVTTWFGGQTTSGTLEVRPLTATGTSTSSAPASGLSGRTTFASSRTFSVATNGATYGQHIPTVPYANFTSKGSIISLQQVAQSAKLRTNLGLVEGSGNQATVEVRIFDSSGAKRGSFNQVLAGGEHKQLNEVLKTQGITALDDGRIEVEVIEGSGKVTAYASVIGSDINDPLYVPPVNVADAAHSKWVLPSVVAGLIGGSGNWQTDVRIFNAEKDPVELTLLFYSMNGGEAKSGTATLAAGKVLTLNSVLKTFLGISQDAGALHVSSAAPARLVVTANTYNDTGKGSYGQFIPAATAEEAVAVGSRPLQILEVEESTGYHSNIGFAEVSGKPVTLEVSVRTPNEPDHVIKVVDLAANEFRQLDSLLSTNTFDARISVRAVAGEGRAIAYVSLVDKKSGDPTYIPGQ